jgi:hypothetical protein
MDVRHPRGHVSIGFLGELGSIQRQRYGSVLRTDLRAYKESGEATHHNGVYKDVRNLHTREFGR